MMTGKSYNWNISKTAHKIGICIRQLITHRNTAVITTTVNLVDGSVVVEWFAIVMIKSSITLPKITTEIGISDGLEYSKYYTISVKCFGKSHVKKC